MCTLFIEIQAYYLLCKKSFKKIHHKRNKQNSLQQLPLLSRNDT